MIGLIVTGHEKFASGMEKALVSITGQPEFFKAVDYQLDQPDALLKEQLEAALEEMAGCDSVLFLCDLAGGVPFKKAVEVGFERGCEIIAGTNLGMLIEMNQVRYYSDDIKEVARQALTVGRDQVMKFEYRPTALMIEEDSKTGGSYY